MNDGMGQSADTDGKRAQYAAEGLEMNQLSIEVDEEYEKIHSPDREVESPGHHQTDMIAKKNLAKTDGFKIDKSISATNTPQDRFHHDDQIRARITKSAAGKSQRISLEPH